MLSQATRMAGTLVSAARALGIASVLVTVVFAMNGCNELKVHDASSRHDGVDSWTSHLRAPMQDTGAVNEKKTKAKTPSFFFDDRARDIEKSLGM